jgi:hypothetical protein
MDLPHHEDHVPVRSIVATIEQGHAQGACSTHAQGACSTCWFQATGACSRNSRISGKGSGHRTNAPQTSQTSSAQTGASTAHDVVPLVTTTTAGYLLTPWVTTPTAGCATPPTAQGRRQKVASSRASGSSGASQSLDGRKQQRELEERRLASATAARMVALADQEIADARFRLSEMDARVSRRGSRGSSDASSKASGVSSSHSSRGRPRTGESDKSRSLGGQLEGMFSSVNEHTVTVHSNVSALQAPREHTGVYQERIHYVGGDSSLQPPFLG